MVKREHHRDKKVDATHPKIRVPGQKGSVQNELRGDLYASAFNHIKDAYDKGFYIECVTICDSMITDRLESYVQFLLHGEEKQYVAESLFNAMKSVGSVTKEKGVRDEEFYELNKKIEEWVPKRNYAVHNFVIVRQTSINEDAEKRKQIMKDAADEGLKLVREVMSYTQKRIKPPLGD